MSKRRIGAWLFGLATVSAIGYTILNYSQGDIIGFNEVMVIAILAITFLSSVTWGASSKDGITPEEELGRKITEISSKVSYYILLLLIFIIVAVELWLTGTVHVSMLIVLALAIILLPFVQFIVARKYQ